MPPSTPPKLTLAFLLLTGCLAASASPGCTCGGPNSVAPAASASASETTEQGVVEVHVDDDPAIVIPRARITQRTTLESLLGAQAIPRSEWRDVVARAGKRYVNLDQLGRLYPDHELALYRDAQGRVCFGAFRPIRPDMPGWMKQKLAEPTPSLVAVESIELRTKERQEVAGVVALDVVVEGKPPVTLDAKKLETLNLDRPFRGSKQVKKGWLLRDVLGLSLDARAMAAIGEVVVKADGGERRVSGDDLRGDEVVPLLKLNRRGELKLFVYGKEGADDELSGVRRIEVRPKAAPGAASSAPKKP